MTTTQNQNHSAGVTGRYTTEGVPHGLSSLTPFVAVPRAAEAIRFYQDVFGARLVDVTEMNGVTVHADLDLGSGHLQLGEPNPDFGLVSPPEPDNACYSLGYYCANADDVVARAESAGAAIREPLETFASGDRFASIRDPFGIRWTIMTRVEDLSEEESAARVAEWASQQG